jgi:hypothetical protein
MIPEQQRGPVVREDQHQCREDAAMTTDWTTQTKGTGAYAKVNGLDLY